MTKKEQYKEVFDTVAASGMASLDADQLMKSHHKKKYVFMNKIAAAIAAILVVSGGSGIAYASNLGGIQRTIQLWIHGDQTNATIVFNGDGSYDMAYPSENGKNEQMGGGGVAFNEDGSERPLTEDELLENINAPDVEYAEDGTVWVYYYNQKIDITDKFQDNLCYLKLETEQQTLYLTVKYENGYAYSYTKYVEPDLFN